VAGGDLSVLKNLFEFDATARAKAQALLEILPEADQSPYATPENLLTLLAAREIPLVEAQWLARIDHDPDSVSELVVMRNAEGTMRQARLTFRRSETGWRLTVPPALVERMIKRTEGGVPPPSPPEFKGPEIPPPLGVEPKGSG
jgi:hypothetical protein